MKVGTQHLCAGAMLNERQQVAMLFFSVYSMETLLDLCVSS